ncbi:hypothetical protein CORC01_00308 [Colletotrichum orchidophilum]|uniref:Uncharacterized protein n=1 Tax=Colletotrichum orchidophilum TaxID=1209926 RepID=A0A1G4BT15_9PEZI|nr:uncharacterized protein CORC01_00308 [Colletotrichum orchidophilum]OHF04456.1 hypothetical protein CORC01_00308 [Colletotrichum orchidophilum]
MQPWPLTTLKMGGYRQGRAPWIHSSLYPVEEPLLHDADTSTKSSSLVDMAGGRAYWEATAGDILMMVQLSALERPEGHWHQQINTSGLNLRIDKFWKCGQALRISLSIYCDQKDHYMYTKKNKHNAADI